jgi:oligopeptide/dipeptide ABC transporter ATP-binding protein
MILRAEGLFKLFRARDTDVEFAAIRDVSLHLTPGETLGIVGESGCGKSTLARLLVGLLTPSAGLIEIEGVPLHEQQRDRRALARRIQLVFQDPFASLNPRLRVRDVLQEVLAVHRLTASRAETAKRTGELLEMVGLAETYGSRYPHELSGGQKQRIGIARALAVEPRTLVLDEPVSALDVSVRAQVMNLLADLRERLGLSYVFISHDLGMVRQISDRVVVMYLGRIVEEGESLDVLDTPLHPYTRALAAAVPTPDPVIEQGKLLRVVAGEVPNPAAPPTGCVFHPRCPLVEPSCRTVEPLLVATSRHRAACHVVERHTAAPSTNSSHE